MDRPLNYGKARWLQAMERPNVIIGGPEQSGEFEEANTSQIRFLDAIDNYRSFNIWIDDDIYIANLAFGDASNYIELTEGNHRLVVTVSAWPEEKPLFDKIIYLPRGQKATMVLTESPDGVDITPLNDIGCNNLGQGLGCLRVANMSYPNSNFDVLYDEEPVFQNLRFKTSSWYKETIVGPYEFSVINATVIGYREEIPILLTRNVALTHDPESVLLEFMIVVEPGANYTAYLIGSPWSLQAVVL